jgi:hypothetical protein
MRRAAGCAPRGCAPRRFEHTAGASDQSQLPIRMNGAQ